MKYASAKELTLLRKLKQRKYRERERLFILEGGRAIDQILENGKVHIERVFLMEGRENYYEHSVPAVLLTNKDAREIFDTESPQGMLALCRMPDETSIDDLAKGNGILVAFDRIQDPGNVGTMMRTASWFGVRGLLISKGTVDMFNTKVTRSTMGAIGALPFASGDLSSMLQYVESKGWDVILLDGNHGAEPLRGYKRTNKMVLVVGNEANGIDTTLLTPHRKRAMIPFGVDNSDVESLNASVALSIGLYHFCTS